MIEDEPKFPHLDDNIPPIPPRELAAFPNGFWAKVDYLLHHTDEVAESLRQDHETWTIVRILIVISLVTAGLYGGVMGATNLLQGSVMAIDDKFELIAVTAVKVPALFLLTLFIVIPPIYVSNAFIGSRMSFGQITAFLLAACTVTVALFFALTSETYHFIKLLHVVMFIYAGISGLTYLNETLNETARLMQRRSTGGLFFVWLLLYMFVGTQLAWVMRPFVGNPGDPFQLFRPRGGNFYESVIQSAVEFLKNLG